ncbi:P-loop containing nucleoside triphosphate hydrolase protein [Gigaspora rosea]|uniref:DNA 3'-5' helicase n=1 Tax=Gigaspora rosea TaxID=44941 RepID=A0A397V689_9GLOM|nr:P-loop containing nucleoside triphosphate hydrolase protein [Gigaspora rosea]
MRIPAAAIFATSNQPLDIQEKIFSEVVAGQIKKEFPSAPLLLLTATCSHQEASKLATILNRADLKVIRTPLVYKPPLVFRTQSKPSKKKDIIKIIYENLTLNSEGQAIIYSSTPNKCIEIFNGLKEYIEPHQLGIYHRKMHDTDQKKTMNLWNNQKLKYIVATNAFGMGVHAPHVRIIIHTTFPLSPTNFDGQLAESLVLYARADIRELLMIVSRKIEK